MKKEIKLVLMDLFFFCNQLTSVSTMIAQLPYFMKKKKVE